MRKKTFIGGSVLLSVVLVTASVAGPAAAITHTTGGRSCNSGYEAQTVAYHRYTVQHGQFTGGTWSYTNKNNGASWAYSYDGYPSQSFSQGTIYGSNSSDVSSVVSTRCV